jgi:flagellar biosynthesis protein FlhF
MSEAEDNTIRFIAKSAQEAAAIVREKLGPEGRVVSVEQVTGSGLKRFVSSPRLQIIAKKMPVPGTAGDLAEKEKEASEVAPEKDFEANLANRGIGPKRPEVNCGALLTRAGFSSNLMARLEGSARWREICDLPAREGLPAAVAWLRQYRSRGEGFSENARIAFVGCAGAGKTTALCKYLAREVFLHGRALEVLQLEVAKPHMDTGLAIYCDILGVPCHQDPGQITGDGALLVDVPGFSLQAGKEQKSLLAALEDIEVTHRVMVMNAAYEPSILEQHTAVADRLHAAYAVYTHLDELQDISKMWSFVLDPDRATLFFANGQNVAGDLVEDCFGYLIERTFPR